MTLIFVLTSGCVIDSKSIGEHETATDGEATTSGTGDDGPIARSCAAGCLEIRAYPETGGCVDTSTSVVVGCDCNPDFGGAPGCVRWEADGTLWMSENTDDLLWDENSGEPAMPIDSGWALCSGDEWQQTRWACDFEGCEAPPESTCSAGDTCSVLASSWGVTCGGTAYGYDEQGCLRPSCETDADCGGGRGCFTVDCVTRPWCAYEVGSECVCGQDLSCTSRSYCVDETVAGSWISLEFSRSVGPCPPGEVCEWTWTVQPNGDVATVAQGEPGQAQLTPGDLELVNGLSNGEQLRTGMADGFVCNEPPTDLYVSLRLELGAGSLEQDVTGCIVSGPENWPVNLLWDTVSAY
jgi:hypothetical protein